jgi:hypothetical protein
MIGTFWREEMGIRQVFKCRAQMLCRDVHVEPPSASEGQKSERREVG